MQEDEGLRCEWLDEKTSLRLKDNATVRTVVVKIRKATVAWPCSYPSNSPRVAVHFRCHSIHLESRTQSCGEGRKRKRESERGEDESKGLLGFSLT